MDLARIWPLSARSTGPIGCVVGLSGDLGSSSWISFGMVDPLSSVWTAWLARARTK